MKKCVFCSYNYFSPAVALLLCTVLFSTQLHAGVYDDCKAWWHFDYDANSNELAEAGEIRDQLDWAGASGFHATYTTGSLESPSWTNEVVSPAGGNTYGGKSIYFSQPTNSIGYCWPDAVKIDDTDLLLHGSATIATRFRWDGHANSASQTVAWVYNNGLYWTTYQGWMFGISGNQLTMLAGHNQYRMSSTTISPGVWYEIAAVLTDNGNTDTIEFYLWAEGSTPKYQKVNATSVTNASSYIKTWIGGETGANSYTTGNAYKCFKGAVNHIAVWDRALSYNEVIEAFCYPQPLIQIGINNTNQNELRSEDEVDETYWPNDPWHTMPRGVNSGSDAILKIPMNAGQIAVDYALHLDTFGTDAESSKANISLIVNTATNAIHSIGRHQDTYWFIPKEDLISGTNTFKLHYNSGTSAYLTFDCLELGGSWQVGVDDNNAGEFVIEGSVPDDYYVTDSDWQHLERAVTSYGQPTINIHFALSSQMLSRYLYTYTTRVVSQSAPGTHAFSIGVNGTKIYSTAGLANNTLVSVPISSELMEPGMNEINLIYDDTSASSYINFDFHRLELSTYGTVILIH